MQPLNALTEFALGLGRFFLGFKGKELSEACSQVTLSTPVQT